jgi:hypothetical protein
LEELSCKSLCPLHLETVVTDKTYSPYPHESPLLDGSFTKKGGWKSIHTRIKDIFLFFSTKNLDRKSAFNMVFSLVLRKTWMGGVYWVFGLLALFAMNQRRLHITVGSFSAKISVLGEASKRSFRNHCSGCASGLAGGVLNVDDGGPSTSSTETFSPAGFHKMHFAICSTRITRLRRSSYARLAVAMPNPSLTLAEDCLHERAYSPLGVSYCGAHSLETLSLEAIQLLTSLLLSIFISQLLAPRTLPPFGRIVDSNGAKPWRRSLLSG